MAIRPLNLMVRLPNWLGDCVMALPAIRHLRESLPEARLFLAGRKPFARLFGSQPGVAGFVEAPASGFRSLAGSLLRGGGRALSAAGVAGGLDTGILLTNSLSTALWLWRIGVRRRVGYALDGRKMLLTDPVPCGGVEKSWHCIRYYLWLAKATEQLEWEKGDARLRPTVPMGEFMQPQLTIDQTELERATALVRDVGIEGKYAVFAPASAYGEVKDWPADYYRTLAEDLTREWGYPVIVTGSAAQAGACEAISSRVKNAVNLAGRTDLASFAALVAGASVFVGGDSGGAHAAAALGIPTLVIFGVTNPARTRPVGPTVRMLGSGGEELKLSSKAAREAARLALAAIRPEEALAVVRDMFAAAQAKRENAD